MNSLLIGFKVVYVNFSFQYCNPYIYIIYIYIVPIVRIGLELEYYISMFLRLSKLPTFSKNCLFKQKNLRFKKRHKSRSGHF